VSRGATGRKILDDEKEGNSTIGLSDEGSEFMLLRGKKGGRWEKRTKVFSGFHLLSHPMARGREGQGGIVENGVACKKMGPVKRGQYLWLEVGRGCASQQMFKLPFMS